MSGWSDEFKIAAYADFPCKGCEERALGCHGTCERYQVAAKLNKDRSAARKEKIDIMRLVDRKRRYK